MLHNNDSFILDKYTPNYLFSHNGNLDNSLRSCFPDLRGLEDINVLTFLPNNMARVFSKISIWKTWTCFTILQAHCAIQPLPT